MQKRIVVTLATQMLAAFEGAQQVFNFECITGDSDHPTDPGLFRILRKDRIHRSAKYGAQMNYAMFFSTDGKAIHQYHPIAAPFSIVRMLKSNISDWFGSHGCVRLEEKNAAVLFTWTPLHTAVQIR